MSLARVRLLVKFAHMAEAPGQHRMINLIGSLSTLKPDIVSNWEHTPRPIGVYISRMIKKRKHSMTAGRATVASIHKEMQKPRLTASVRSAQRGKSAPVAKQPGPILGKRKFLNPGAKSKSSVEEAECLRGGIVTGSGSSCARSKGRQRGMR